MSASQSVYEQLIKYPENRGAKLGDKLVPFINNIFHFSGFYWGLVINLSIPFCFLFSATLSLFLIDNTPHLFANMHCKVLPLLGDN